MRGTSGLLWALLLALLLPAPAAADTLIERAPALGTIQKFNAYLGDVRFRLYANDSDTRKEAYKLVQRSVKEAKADGEADFPLRLLGDVILGVGLPPGGRVNKDLQADALELLSDTAKNRDLSLSQREVALEQIVRITAGQPPANEDIRDDTFSVLTKLSEDKALIISHGAMAGLGAIVASRAEGWSGKRSKAVSRIVDRLEDDSREVRRAAFLIAIHVLTGTRGKDSAAADLWEGLADGAKAIESPAFLAIIAPPLKQLIDRQRGTPYADLAAQVRKRLDAFDVKLEPMKDPFPDVLRVVRESGSGLEKERALRRIEFDALRDGTRLLLGFSAIAARASAQEASTDEVGLLDDSLVRLAQSHDSALPFYRLCATLLEQAYTRAGRGDAHLALVELARMLAATDAPSLVLPVLNEIRFQAMSPEQPAWVAKRMIGLLFLQAGDSPVAELRSHAMEQIERIGKNATRWTLRQEVLQRMQQLQLHARDGDVKARAKTWLES